MSFDELPSETRIPPYGPSGAGSQGSSTSAGLLLFGGVCLVLLGLALALAPEFVPEAKRIAGKLAGRGLSFEVVGALGATLFGLGLVLKSLARIGGRVDGLRDEQVDLSLLLERVVGELADLRASTDRSRASSASAEAQVGAAQSEKDALFRMAASLDQLSGRIEKRVQSDLASLGGELERIGQNLGRVEQRLGQLEARRPVAAQQPAPPLPAQPVAPRAGARPVPVAPPVPASPFVQSPAPFEADARGRREDEPIMIDLDAQERALELFDRMDDRDGGAEGAGAPSALPGRRNPNSPRQRGDQR